MLHNDSSAEHAVSMIGSHLFLVSSYSINCCFKCSIMFSFESWLFFKNLKSILELAEIPHRLERNETLFIRV